MDHASQLIWVHETDLFYLCSVSQLIEDLNSIDLDFKQTEAFLEEMKKAHFAKS